MDLILLRRTLDEIQGRTHPVTLDDEVLALLIEASECYYEIRQEEIE